MDPNGLQQLLQEFLRRAECGGASSSRDADSADVVSYSDFKKFLNMCQAALSARNQATEILLRDQQQTTDEVPRRVF
jgi:hypothetical protein